MMEETTTTEKIIDKSLTIPTKSNGQKEWDRFRSILNVPHSGRLCHLHWTDTDGNDQWVEISEFGIKMTKASLDADKNVVPNSYREEFLS